MKIEQSEIKDLTAVLSITIEPADYQETVQQELKKIRQKAQIPGFRPGMVPLGLVKKMYGKGVLADVLNRLVGENLQKHIEEKDLHVLGDPMPNDELTKNIDLDNEDTFTFAFDIAVAPEFDAKLNGKNKLTYYTIDVTDEMVDKQVQSYADRFGEYVEVEDVKEGDVLRGLLTEQKEGGIVKENAILNPQYMKEKKQQKLFAKAKKGDIITFNPMKAYGSEVEVSSMLSISKEEATGLESDFTFEIQSITRHEASKIDGELFAKVYGNDVPKDEKEFRARVKAELEQNMAEDSKYKFGLDAKEAIMKKMEKVALPETFLKNWVLKTDEKMTAEQLDKEFPAMLEQLKWQLAKDQLMKAYEIKVEKEDVEAYAKEVARMQFMQYGLMHIEDQYLDNYAQEMLKKEDQLRGIVERVAENKIYEAVKGVAKIEEKTISHEDFGKLFN
ncbi:MAG: trigger factor [Paludibacteraceae bacterium]|jgi:trigger factor|nr:trigger factor [Paludibacteraceae bacterium]MBR1716682.1 trigger factor [Paludibacteraceae bacterium]